MIQTKNNLDGSKQEQVIELLNSRLADCIDLQSQTKQAHWNVKGPSFIGLHKLFDEVAESIAEYVDMIAERAVQLGGVAKGTVRSAAGASELSEYPLTITAGTDHVDALSSALAAFAGLLRTAIDEADEMGDPDTADLFTEVSSGIEKWLWFVEAHNQANS